MGATVFAALATVETIEAWWKIAQVLEFSTLTLTAAPMALVIGLPAPQGVLLDIGGATTDLTLWRAGKPVILDSLATGGGAITLALSRRWNLPLDEAERLKRAYVGGLLDERDSARVLEVMSPVVRAWVEDAEGALAAMDQGELLPERLYLLGGGSALPEMAEAARSLAWSERLQFVRHPQVACLRPTEVPGVVNRTELGRASGDVAALALVAWAARQHQPFDRPSRILSELCEDLCSK
jgi:cell division protein FtsA